MLPTDCSLSSQIEKSVQSETNSKPARRHASWFWQEAAGSVTYRLRGRWLLQAESWIRLPHSSLQICLNAFFLALSYETKDSGQNHTTLQCTLYIFILLQLIHQNSHRPRNQKRVGIILFLCYIRPFKTQHVGDKKSPMVSLHIRHVSGLS